MDGHKWTCPTFDTADTPIRKLIPVQTTKHPLESQVIIVSDRKSSTNSTISKSASKTTTSWGGLDPLSDPLSALAIDDTLTEPIDEVILKWPSFKSKVLSRFRTTNRMTFKSSFLSIAKASASATSSMSTSGSMDQVKLRLQSLDELNSTNYSSDSMTLSADEFSSKMSQLNQLLSDSWNADQRVKSLKVVIQVTKLLSEIPEVSFYPSQFVLIVTLLDSFGSLVSSRIGNKMDSNCNNQDIAMETTRNWFYKVSSIRELIPRFFIEISILKIYKYILNPGQIDGTLRRLSITVNGISNPIVSIYARTYLAKTLAGIFAGNLNTGDAKNSSVQNVIFDNFKSIFSLSAQLRSFMNLKEHHSVLSPALDWIINCFKALKGDQQLLLDHLLVERDAEPISDAKSSSETSDATPESRTEAKSVPDAKSDLCIRCIALNSIINHCSDPLIESNHGKILDFILDIEIGCDYPITELISSLGHRITSSRTGLAHCDQSIKKGMINRIWKRIASFKLIDYLTCAASWIEFVLINLTIDESGIVLNDLLKKATTGTASGANGSRGSDAIDSALLSIVKSVSKLTTSVSLITQNVVPLLSVIRSSDAKIQSCKSLISVVISSGELDCGLKNSDANYLDQETSKSLYLMCKLLASSIDFMTNEDEKRSISALITNCLRIIMSWRLAIDTRSLAIEVKTLKEETLSEEELETQLNLLMEARSDFIDLEPVTAFLVFACNSLAVACYKSSRATSIKGKASRSLIQSCLAFSYITIPSLTDHAIQLQLYLNASQVALMTASLSQTDSFLKASITLLNSLPAHVSDGKDGKVTSLDTFFATYSSNLLSLLILVPDHPDMEIIYLVKALHSVVSSREMSDPGQKCAILFKFLSYATYSAQVKYPIRIIGVDSNDKLFGGDERFMNELNNLGSKVLNEILDLIALIKNDQKKMMLIIKSLLDCIHTYGAANEMAKLITRLNQLLK